jgi:hypothetical protein
MEDREEILAALARIEKKLDGATEPLPSAPAPDKELLLIIEIAQSLADAGPLKMSAQQKVRLDQLKPIFKRVAANRIEAAFLAGIAWTESDFVPTAVNKTSGAAGLMQIMPFHFSGPKAWLGWSGDDWQNPEKNIRAGRQILINSGFGKKSIRETLKNYGGFVTKDPNDYIAKVTQRAMYLLPKFIV